jgi:hypothetical protein
MNLPPRVHNWGCWGADDEIGTANYITSESNPLAIK